MGWYDEPRRSLGIRNKQIVWERAGRKCQNCSKEISFTEMQVGHKTAFSKGGSTTMKNSVCLCYACNKLQGTDSWGTFQKKLGREDTAGKTRNSLNTLSIRQLKFLADKHNIRVKSRVSEGWFSDTRIPPGKRQYITALSKVVTDADIEFAKTSTPKPAIKPKKKSSSSWW